MQLKAFAFTLFYAELNSRQMRRQQNAFAFKLFCAEFIHRKTRMQLNAFAFTLFTAKSNCRMIDAHATESLCFCALYGPTRAV